MPSPTVNSTKPLPSKPGNHGLIAAIVFAALIVAGALVFVGIKFGGGVSEEELQAKVFQGIGYYIEDQQKEYAKAQEEANKPRKVEGDFTDDDAVLGDEDAPVTIVEFSDYQCPYCKAFYTDTLPTIKEKYIDTGKVKLIYRDLPLSIHQDAYPAALLAECARDQGGDEVYYAMHDKIFETISAGFDYDALSAYAGTLGVNTGELKECFDSDKFKAEISADEAAADSVGISGTPGFIVNNNVVSGARPFDYFANIIEAELAEEE